MSEQETSSLPWVGFYGLKRPKFEFTKIRFTIPTTVPSSLVFSLVFLGILYIYIGGVYDLVEDPLAFGGAAGGGPQLIWPSADRQFLLEGIVAGLLMFLGAIGLYLISQATNDPHDTERASRFQFFGVLLLVVAFFILQNMYQCKIDSTTC